MEHSLPLQGVVLGGGESTPLVALYKGLLLPHQALASYVSSSVTATNADIALAGSNYDPFASPAFSALRLAPVSLVLLALLLSIVPSWRRWAPSFVARAIKILSPFVTDEDLVKADRRRTVSEVDVVGGQGNEKEPSLLRRGAILDEDFDVAQYDDAVGFARQGRRNAHISAIALAEAIVWSSIAAFHFSRSTGKTTETVLDNFAVISASWAVTWLFILLCIFAFPPATPPIFLLLLGLLQMINAAVRLLQFLPIFVGAFDQVPWMSVAADLFDLLACYSVVRVILSMPVHAGGFESQVPKRERKVLASGQTVTETEDIKRDYESCPTTPEDYASLLSTLTYSWMHPIQALSLRRPLLPADVWRLRSINDTRILSANFAKTTYKNDSQTTDGKGQKRSLRLRLFIANANDISLDFFYKICGVTLAYAGPALMNQILQCVTDAAAAEQQTGFWVLTAHGFIRPAKTEGYLAETDDVANLRAPWTPRQKAFVLALVSLAFTFVRYVAELKNFHHARQVGLRLRSVLVVEMFEKALKRRNISGASTDDKPKDSEEAGKKTQKRAAQQAANDTEDSEAQQNESAPLLGSNGDENGKSKKDKSRGKASAEQEKDDKGKDETSRQADVGKVVNMMASDINRLLRLGCDSHQLYGAPLELVISTVFLYRLMGWSSIVGFLLMAFATPMTYYLGKKLTKLQKAWKEATDRRISLVAELITAIRFVKLQGTEERWKERVLETRRVELDKLLAQRLSSMALTMVYVVMPILCELVTFYIYVAIQGRAMTVPVAFTAITLFEMARTPLSTIPTFIMNILESIVSIRRLESFLDEEEVEEAMSSLKSKENGTLEDSAARDGAARSPLQVINGHFSWINAAEIKAGQKPFSLVNINVSFPQEGLSVVVGPTASGKSSMLAALLGEMKRDSGTVELVRFSPAGDSLISFAGQAPWLEAGKSIKANIIFVTPFDEERYNEVLDACALIDDLIQLEDGDETRVSKETLSGGQKARLCLARALYHRSHTVLLDDVLAAVDTRVQRYLYQHALTGPIARNRRIILITHHLHLVLPSVDYLVILRQGHVEAAGTVEELKSKGHDLEGSVVSSIDEAEKKSEKTAKDATTQQENDGGKAADQVKENGKPEEKKARLLYDLEKRTEGQARFKSYWLYVSVSNIWGWVLLILLSISVRVLKAGEPYWLKVWGEASQATHHRPNSRLPPAEGHEFFYLGVYASIEFAYVIVIIVRFLYLYVICLKASKNLYDKLLSQVLRARMRFFDSNPTGRILQRFNLDVNILDSALPTTILYFIALLLAFTSQFLIVVVIVPGFLIPSALGIALTVWGVQGYLRSTMYMQRIESTSTSPLYTAFTQILEGLTTVRAFGSESYFLDHMQTINAITSSQWWAICTIEVWLSFRAQVASGLSVFVATTLALSGAVSPGSAGMVISAASLLTTFAYNLTSMYKNLSNHTNSLERIAEYIDLDQEAPLKVNGVPLPAAWPTSSGGIQVEKLKLRYADDLPEVLHGVSFDIKPREKVAIVGRTGSGKTSLTAALLRAVEPFNTGDDGDVAKIVIDGIDVLQCGLEYRARLAVVPQDPVLFSGTVRENLDAFGEYSDDECRAALVEVQGTSPLPTASTSLSSTSASSSPSTPPQQNDEGEGAEPGSTNLMAGQLLDLDTVVAPGGSNFSAGQAQLLSLARALLKQSKVVILDEATSSTDFETDARIQQAIRGLQDSIILTVAHRLGSVIDYDRILVLSNGNIVEFDTPANLLRNVDGHFNMLCRQAGQTTYRQLCAAAGVESN